MSLIRQHTMSIRAAMKAGLMTASPWRSWFQAGCDAGGTFMNAVTLSRRAKLRAPTQGYSVHESAPSIASSLEPTPPRGSGHQAGLHGRTYAHCVLPDEAHEGEAGSRGTLTMCASAEGAIRRERRFPERVVRPGRAVQKGAVRTATGDGRVNRERGATDCSSAPRPGGG